MLIAGTGGLGKEILGILIDNAYSDTIVFYDENKKAPDYIFDIFKVIKSETDLKKYFSEISNKFIVGIGHPRIREKVYNRLKKQGGIYTNVVSKSSHVFQFNDEFQGCIIQPGAGISHGVKIDMGSAIHINATIGHSVIIGKFVNLGPSTTIIGPCRIGDYAYISAQATILPNVTVGKNAIISAGCVVKRNVEDNETYTEN